MPDDSAWKKLGATFYHWRKCGDCIEIKRRYPLSLVAGLSAAAAWSLLLPLYVSWDKITSGPDDTTSILLLALALLAAIILLGYFTVLSLSRIRIDKAGVTLTALRPRHYRASYVKSLEVIFSAADPLVPARKAVWRLYLNDGSHEELLNEGTLISEKELKPLSQTAARILEARETSKPV